MRLARSRTTCGALSIDRSTISASDRTPLTAAVSSAANSRLRPSPPRWRAKSIQSKTLCAAGALQHFHCQGGSDRVAGWHARRPLLVPARSLSRAALRPSAGDAARIEPRTCRPSARRPGVIGSTRLRRSSRSTSNAVTSQGARQHHQRAAAKARVAAPMPKRSSICAAHSMRSSTSPTMSIALVIEVELRVALGAAFITTRDLVRRKCWMLTDERRRFAIASASALISFPRSGANGHRHWPRRDDRRAPAGLEAACAGGKVRRHRPEDPGPSRHVVDPPRVRRARAGARARGCLALFDAKMHRSMVPKLRQS